MTALQLGNLSLKHLGITVEIEDLDETSPAAAQVRAFYDMVLRICLHRHPWSFATKYLELTLARGPFWNTDPTVLTLVQAWSSALSYVAGDVVRLSSVNYYCLLAHSNQSPPNATYWSTAAADAPDYHNGDWRYAYRYPSDCVKGRRIVDDRIGRRDHAPEIPWRRGRDEKGLLIETNRPAATLEYTMLDCIDLWTDDVFLMFFTWTLAAEISPGLERAQKTKKECLEIAEIWFLRAAAADMTEQQQEPQDNVPEWTRNR